MWSWLAEVLHKTWRLGGDQQEGTCDYIAFLSSSPSLQLCSFPPTTRRNLLSWITLD
jgi:hypothetical protein